MIRLSLVPITLLLLPLAPGQHGPGGRHPGRPMQDLPPILRRALGAVSHQRYIGTRTVEFRRNGTPLRHDETITRDGSLVRIDFPEGSPLSGQVIVENQLERRHFFPDKNEIHILPPRREEAYERLARVARGRKGEIKVSVSAGQPVAGLKTEQVVFSDRDGNVVQRIFIEPDSGVILKRTMFDAVGTPQGGFEFTRIDLTPHIDHAVFRLQRRGAKYLTPADLLERLAKNEGFASLALPISTGFRLEGSVVRKIDNERVLVQTYGSGSGTRLTLFQLKSAVSPDRLSQYASRQNLKFVYWQALGNTFVLVGNVDAPALLRIAGPISGGTAVAGR